MSVECFYCGEVLSEKPHFVSFFHNEDEREETLCPDCYRDWLEGIKE